MNDTSTMPPAAGSAQYELCHWHLFETGHGFAFPCDAQRNVIADELSERALHSYRDARSRVGIEFGWPRVERRSLEGRP